ncbi:glycosyltransferase family 1 protein [Pseudoalteromonas sp. S2721]|uniref:glycosyltransferase family 4 protein n=1 Tax=Pseudoalteromonas sp. S2721 TaxID=579526 RepID=UPI00110AF237|nr:glycosyltransferase family 4 protein [Pseudoalteromonas sp. S2721]TMP14476.1 glycosyltransferase family 1 protein [Pseudoalteromonas sp. S2721]
MKSLLYIINADWYFDLHWLERAIFFKGIGYEIHVVMPVNEPEIIKKLETLGLYITVLPIERTSMSIINEIKILNRLNKLIKTVNPDIIHSVTIKPNLYSTILCRLNNIPLVSTYPGLGTLGVSKDLKYVISRKVIFSLIKVFSKKQSNVALFENEEDLQLFEDMKVIPKSRLIRVFGAGINLDSFSFSNIKNGNANSLNLLFASRLLKNKGLSLLFDSVKKLNNQGFNVRLKIAGIFDFDSPFAYTQDEIEEMASFDFVDWLGKRSDIKDLIANSDVVCLPTTYGEGVPRILIEACAVGRPIITTPLGGCKDICVDNYSGLLVEPDSVESIIKALKQLITNKDLKSELGQNGRKLVEDKFSNHSVFEQHREIYLTQLSKAKVSE